jgi:hypothetical protein
MLPAALLAWVGVGSRVVFPIPVDGKADFEAVLQQVQRTIEGRRFKEAKELLLAKLAEHKDKDYVRAKLDEITADLKTCSFNLKHPRKQVADLLSAQVVSYEPKTGQISLTWRKDAKAKDGTPVKFPGDDFETEKADRTLKLPFEGPFSVQFTGKAMGQTPPTVRVCIREDEWYEVVLDAGDASTIYKLSGGDRKHVADATTSAMNVARPYVLKYTVRETQIEASFNGARMIQGKKEKDVYGQLGFRNVAELERIDVSGKAKVAWIEEKIDAIAEKELAAFEKTYDAKADLPAWLQ